MAEDKDIGTTLRKYACVIIDECHERTINTDVLLGFVKQALLDEKIKN